MRQSGRVKTSIPIAGSGDRILLLHWGTSLEPRFHNVVRINVRGAVLWRLELPGKAAHDCFVKLERDGDHLLALTHSRLRVRFDSEGRVRQGDLETVAH